MTTFANCTNNNKIIQTLLTDSPILPIVIPHLYLDHYSQTQRFSMMNTLIALLREHRDGTAAREFHGHPLFSVKLSCRFIFLCLSNARNNKLRTQYNRVCVTMKYSREYGLYYTRLRMHCLMVADRERKRERREDGGERQSV